MIARTRHLKILSGLLERHPVVAIVGARQVGKTTMARQLVARRPGGATIFDLENPDHLARLAEPMLALADLEGLVVIDEIQLRPELFPLLRVLVDREAAPARFLVLGSASPDLLRQSSESLAGRIIYHQLEGFALDEVGNERYRRLWLRGGFPRAYLAASAAASAEWRRGFVKTFLERDMPQLGIRIPPETMRRFWTMLAHLHGQTWNGSELARAMGVGHATVRRYLDLLTSALVVRQLPPFFSNIGKRLVRSPKVYVADSGVLHTLLGLETRDDLELHPKVGASWEGFALAEVTTHLGARSEECFFWGTHGGAELDLVVQRGRRRIGFEFKRTTAPRTTRSMHHALEDLELDRIDVVHAGTDTFPLAERVRALSLARLLEDLEPLG